jgi:CubicO group peptidase (beta-lactamase class C family)
MSERRRLDMKRMYGFKTIVTAVLFLILFSTAVADEKTDKVDQLFSRWEKTNSPGCALAIIQDGRVIYKHGYGMANLEHSIPISPGSVFYIGSCSKQFVAMCIALLSAEGKLSLDDDIHKYIPEMPDYGILLTVRHLIHHTSGLRDYLTLLGIIGMDFGTYHEDDVLELIARQKELNFKPGEEYLYSNSGYFLLAVIVERASGKSLREYAEENIFKPLGMRNSRFHDDYTELIPNRAFGYFPGGKDKYRNFISTFDCVGSGGLFTSVEDLFLWDQNFYHHRVGGKDVMEIIHTKGKLNNGQELDYAFALRISSYKGLKTVDHGGALGGYRSYMVRFPEQNFSVICLSNLSSINPTKLSQQIADIYLADEFEKAKEEIPPLKEDRISPEKEIKISEKKLKERAGDYIEPQSGEVIRLFLKDGKLNALMSGQSYVLAARSEAEFYLLDVPVGVVLKFEKKEKDMPCFLHVLQEGEPPRIFQSFQPVKLSPEQLKEYEGEYFSEELQVTFRLGIKEDRLHFSHKNAPRGFLNPTLQDKFTLRNLKVHFLRDEEGRIAAFTLDAGRVKNLRFVKRSMD